MMEKKKFKVLSLILCIALLFPSFALAQMGTGPFRGVSDSFSGDVILENGEAISNSSDGIICLEGQGGTNNEDICFDLESTSNRVLINSNTSGKPTFVDGVFVGFGNSADARLQWENSGNDNFQIGVAVGSASQSGYVSLMQDADMSLANRSPLATSPDPVLRVYSSDATEANDYIEQYHNGTNAFINSGNGNQVFNSSAFRLQQIFTDNGVEVSTNVYDKDTDEVKIAVDDDGGNQLILTNFINATKDHDHATTTNPTLFIHSDTDPDVSNNQWGSISHNQSRMVIRTGSETGSGSAPTTIDNSIYFNPQGTTRMVIKGDGNVGIGTSAPKSMFEIKDVSSLKIAPTADEIGIRSDDWGTDIDLTTAKAGGAGTNHDQLFLDSSGNIGIGTSTPAQKLQIQGSCIRMQSPDTSYSDCCVDNSDVWTCTGI